jgi:hypothetical protein
VRVAFTFNVQQHAKLIAGAAEFATPAAPERFTPGQSAPRRGREVAAP